MCSVLLKKASNIVYAMGEKDNYLVLVKSIIYLFHPCLIKVPSFVLAAKVEGSNK